MTVAEQTSVCQDMETLGIRQEQLGHKANLFSAFGEFSTLISKVGRLLCSPTGSEKEFPFLHILAGIGCQWFSSSQPLWLKQDKNLRVALIGAFRMAFEILLFKPFLFFFYPGPFFNWVICSLDLFVCCSLYILNINLANEQMAKILSLSIGFCITLWIILW